jgi:hypothetical protein
MKAATIKPSSRNVLQRIALELKKDPTKVRVFANRLRSKIWKAKSSDEVSDHQWEWYAILTLWPPLEVIRLLEDPSENAARLRGGSPLVFLLSEDERSTYLVLSDRK